MMNLTAKYSNSTFLYFIICFVGVIFPLISFSKNKAASSIKELQRMKSFIVDDLAITIPIYVRFGDRGFNFPDLVDATQIGLDYELLKIMDTNWRFKLVNELTSNWSSPDDGKYILELTHSDGNSVTIDTNLFKAQIHYTQASIHANDLPFYITQATLEHLMSAEIEMLRFLETSDQAVDHDFIDVKIIIIGLKSKHYASIFEWNLNAFDSFRTEVLDLSNVTITVTTLESLFEDYNIINSPRSLHYIYSDIHNEVFIPTEMVYPICVSYIHNDSLTNEDAAHFISKITKDLEDLMGLPKNPTNNLGMKVYAMKRYLTLKGFIESIDYLLTATMRNKRDSVEIGKFASNLYSVIDCLHNNESKHDWSSLLAWSREFKHVSSQFLED